MKEELNEEPKAEQEGSGRAMLVERRMGMTGGCGMQKEGHTLAFWLVRLTGVSQTAGLRPAGACCYTRGHDLSYTVGLLCSFTTKRRGRGKADGKRRSRGAQRASQPDCVPLRTWVLQNQKNLS
jgi:hypothetical protein